MFTGKRNGYAWVEWEWHTEFIADLLPAFPQLVVGKYLVNTTFDSGPLSLSQKETSLGWLKYDKLALSPVIGDVDEVPYCHYSEWYVFASPVTFDDYEVFINYGGFSLELPDFETLQERFWSQLERLAPESFLAEGDNLICVIRDVNLFNQLSQWGDEEEKRPY
jgi:hypothetical protein